MRRTLLAGIWLVPGMIACASMNPPPGGPTDSTAPQVASVSVDSGAVNVRPSAVEFRFDEVINDRLEPAELSRLVLLSPQDGEPRVEWGRRSVEVRPRRGWRPNTTYTVTLLPGVGDLRGNRTKQARSIMFSTGPAIATQALVGRTFDWPAERVATGALVEARPVGDTIVAYLAASDSVGAFSVGPLPGGEYRVRGYVDGNRNRQLDRGEIWDSTTVTTTAQQTLVELYLAPRDTLPPRILTVTVVDSLHLSVEFDRAIDPNAGYGSASFRLRRTDSTDVPILGVLTKRLFDEAQRRADSVAAA
ncbi:MAG TPA: Ig-like domain-containing protein, partial [Gemmatimonadaceae bacterium]|nr:Ig-like domain-containing protein [Gemmatimonadaceae bacterium]